MRDYRQRQKLSYEEKQKLENTKVDLSDGFLRLLLRDRLKLMVERTINANNPEQQINEEIARNEKRRAELFEEFRQSFDSKHYVSHEIMADMRLENYYFQCLFAHLTFFPLYKPYLKIKKELENHVRTK